MACDDRSINDCGAVRVLRNGRGAEKLEENLPQ
jgi:hypothetical protein